MDLYFDVCQDRVMVTATALAPSCCFVPDAVSPESVSDLATMFKALGDPVRLQMLAMIATQHETCVCEISPAFELSSATISHHLKTLREAGLVACERRGTFVYYRVEPAALQAMSSVFESRD